MTPVAPAPRRAVLLMAYGGPARLEEVEPFLLDVRGGRPTPPELVEEVRERYRAIGGGSPILARTREQAAALEARLNRLGEPDGGGPWRVFVGMRHWHPYIRQAVGEIAAGGFERLVALCLAPQYSAISVGAYLRSLDAALEEAGEAGARLRVTRIPSWHDHPGFVAALAEEAGRARDAFAPEERAGLQVVFTAHSIPVSEPGEGAGADPYAAQVRETAEAVAGRAGIRSWRLAYQSAGARPGAWLGPSLGEVLRELAAAGRRSVLVAPVGFVSDHVEVLYDLDVEARARAAELGLHLERTASLNASPRFIDALADLVGGASVPGARGAPAVFLGPVP